MSFAHRLIRTKPIPDPAAEDLNPTVVSAELLKISSTVGERELSWPRGSKLYDMCVRQFVIGTIERAVVKEWNTVAGRVTFGIGNALHFWMQNSPDLFGDKRRGWWKCLACRRIVGFGGPPRKKCRFCGAYPEAIIYSEHGIKLSGDPVYLTGHTDMFLEHRKLLRVTELKSMDGDKWEKLAAPVASHERQLQSYMWALERDKRIPFPIDRDVGYLAYVSKKMTMGKLPVKVYPVERSEPIIKQILDDLMAYKRGVDNWPNATPPPHHDCERTVYNCYRAKSCPVRERCTRAN